MATVDPAAVIGLANAHDFRASRSLWHGEPLQHGDFALFDPDGSGCDCGTPRIRRIGVLRIEAGDLPDDWQPPSTTAASVESLLRIAPRTPTWLLVP